MRILWSLPVRGEYLGSGRGDLVRAQSLIEALTQAGHEVKTVEFGSPRAVSAYRNIFSRMMPGFAAKIVRDAGRWLASMGHGHRVALGAVEFGADAIVETQVGFSFSGAIAAESSGLPLILDDCSPSREEEILGAGLPCLARRALRRQARAASVLAVTSHDLMESLVREGLPPEKIRIMPNGIDLQAYAVLNRETLRSQMDFANRCVIGFAGSFQPWHGTDLLMAALAGLSRDLSWSLLLVGDGPHLKPALQRLNLFGLGRRVTVTGSVPPGQVPALIACFEIGVLPGSNDYGHPMKLLEYAAAGAAIIAPDLPPVRRMVQHFKTGLLFPRGDAEGLTGALSMLICRKTLRRRLADAALCSIGHKDSWSARGHDLAAVVESVVAKNPRAAFPDDLRQ